MGLCPPCDAATEAAVKGVSAFDRQFRILSSFLLENASAVPHSYETKVDSTTAISTMTLNFKVDGEAARSREALDAVGVKVEVKGKTLKVSFPVRAGVALETRLERKEKVRQKRAEEEEAEPTL